MNNFIKDLFFVNIGNNKELPCSKIKYIVSPEQFELIKDKINIQAVFSNGSEKVLSYIIFEEFEQFYAFSSNFSPANINKKMEKVYSK